MSRVVIIGATGHIGSYLVPRLVRGGHEVIAMSRGIRGPYLQSPEWDSVTTIAVDRDAADAEGTFGTQVAALRPDVVIDLICFSAASAQQLVDALRPSRPLLVHCGTIWVHGPALRVPVTEDEPRAAYGEYGTGKAEIEALLHRETRAGGVPAIVLHPGHISGPGWPVITPAGNLDPAVWTRLATGQPLALPDHGEQVLVMQYLDGRPLLTGAAGLPAQTRAALARDLLDSLLGQVMLSGTFHADPHPGNILLLSDGHLGLLDWGSVGRIDAGLRGALQRLLLALDRGDPVMLRDALLDVVDRPEQLDEPRLERALGRFLARYFAAGIAPDVRMFTDLFRIVADYGLAVPPEIAAVFRALATMEGTLTQLAPGFDIVAEARRFGEQQLVEQLSPEAIKNTAADELTALVPMLRRLPRRIDRIGGALEDGRLTVGVRLLADASDRRYLTGLVHQVLLAFLAAAAGIMAVLMIGLRGGPALSKGVSLYTFFGYCLLVIAAILAVRVLVQVFRPDPG